MLQVYERDPFEPNPEWIDWVLTLITVKDIIDVPRGSSVGRIALIEAEVLASRSAQVNVGEITNKSIPLSQDTTMWHLSDELRRYVCLDKKAEVEIGAAFLVATYYHDSADGMSRSTVTSQWKA